MKLIITKMTKYLGILFGIALVITGIVINYFGGMKGQVVLHPGISKILSVTKSPDTLTGENRSDLGLVLTLDSLILHSFTPEYTIELRKPDTSISKDIPPIGIPPNKVVSRFSLAPMKIRKIEKTDLFFRLKEFFPDFVFSYSYPEKKDTIAPRAPGIQLELKTIEGSSVVTLLSDQPNRSTLVDLTGLGASLAYYWMIPTDSIQSMANHEVAGGNKIVFSGENQKVYFLFGGKVEEQTLEEKNYYKITGHDSTGFTILHSFPDVAYLKAIPSSKGNDPIHPVANVEIWKSGQRSQEAYIYPETNGLKGGEFMIPESDYILGLGVSNDQVVKNCDCKISIKNHAIQKQLTFKSGQGKSYNGFRFKPMACNSGLSDELILQVTYNPGNKFVIFGFLIIFCTGTFLLLKKKTSAMIN